MSVEPPHSSKRIIINADDYGFAEEINKNIIACYKAGSVHRVSLCAHDIAGIPESFALLKEEGIRAIGIHIVLVGEGRPLSGPIKGLTSPEGFFFPRYPEIIKNFFLGKIDMVRVKQEVEAQIERIKREGFILTHLDSHQHTHLFPFFTDFLLECAQEYGIPYVRCPYSERRTLLGAAVRYCAAQLRKKIQNKGLQTSNWFKGFDRSCRVQKKDLIAMLHSLPPGVTELMVHPGHRVDRTAPGKSRDQETHALLSDDVREMIAEYEIGSTEERAA
ncbi:MAG: ChbG/HpnK family deacetylase [Candidatus Omnitrophica bacterium]|nr:ChbG/HpnK family deacetylase [Candidatus Omnitrophota bacterium]